MENPQRELHTRVETEESNDRGDDVQNKPGFFEVAKGEEGTKVFRNRKPPFHRLFRPKVNDKLCVHEAATYEVGNA